MPKNLRHCRTLKVQTKSKSSDRIDTKEFFLQRIKLDIFQKERKVSKTNGDNREIVNP